MGRSKLVVGALVLENGENLTQKISSMFATERLIGHFSEENQAEYRAVLSHKNVQTIFRDRSIMQTVSSFFGNGLNISKTSEKTYMHRNTLNYRIDKIEKFLGLNLKLFDHAVLFRNMLIVFKIVFADELTLIRRKKNQKVEK